MKICFISKEYPPETGFGGIGTYTYQLAQELSKKGHNITVISKAIKSERIYKDKKVKVYRIFDEPVPFRGFTRISNLITKGWFSHYWHSRSVFKKIIEIINREEDFDIIEAPLWDSESLAYSEKINIPLVVRLQTPIFKSRELLNIKPNKTLEKIEKATLEKAILIPSISKNVGKMITKHYGLAQNKIRVNHLGLNLLKIKKPIFISNSFKLLYVGRLELRKGTEEFINSLNEILTKNLDITIDIVGKDIPQAPGNIFFKDYFKQTVNKNLQSRVKFYGFVNDKNLQKFYKNCDCLIAPSRYESFGLIFLEAFKYGKPVIGTRVGGIPEVVKENKTGLLVDANNPEQISKAVLKIFKNEKLRKRLGENAFKDVRVNFSSEKMAEETLHIYNEAVQKFRRKYA